MKASLRVLVLLAALAGAAAAVAATGTTSPAAAASPAASAPSAAPASTDPRALIISKLPGTRPEEVRPSPVPGLYELMHGTDAAYVTADGKYAIAGDLYELGTNTDITEAERRQTRLRLLGAIPESDMVIFGPKDARHTVTVFTDVDCAYCRKLHSQIADYNRLGIRVRYVSYPRTGPNSESWTRAEQVWCAANRNEALTRAKRGESLTDKPCAHSPVAREYALGREFNLQGTPAIVLANGDMLPGYLSPTELADELKSVAH